MPSAKTDLANAPVIKLVRHELKFRTLTVKEATHLTPSMIRIILTGADLKDFPSMAPDDHIKVLVPGENGETVMRDYTPRRYSREDGELTLDFAVHDAGPATRWALGAEAGDPLEIAGPRGSRIISGDIAHWLMIGDETALPAIGRRLEEAAPGERFTIFVTVPTAEDAQAFDTPAHVELHWIAADAHGAGQEDALMARIRAFDLPEDCFIWIAAEGVLTRQLRSYFLEERGHSKFWLKASGYWVRGQADATVKFE